jgi:plastocyanin
LIAALCGALVGLPALAAARGETPTVTAEDSPTLHFDNAEVSIETGGTVKFQYPGSGVPHDVVFTSGSPDCSGLPPKSPDADLDGWSGSCRFEAAGTYKFVCEWHESLGMTGTVRVTNAPGGSPTPTVIGGTPTPTPDPGGTPTPGPGTTPPAPQSTLKGAVTLARSQRGSRVRGSVAVKAAKSRLDVGVWVPRSKLSGGKSHKAVRVGRFVKTSTAAGRVRFSIKVNAKARTALRRARRLAVTVSVALTPPGGRKLTRRQHTTLKPG